MECIIRDNALCIDKVNALHIFNTDSWCDRYKGRLKMQCYQNNLHNKLIDWIDEKMPGVGGMKKVKIKYCDKLPFEWIAGSRKNITGITLWNSIYIRSYVYPIEPYHKEKVELLFHELVHIEQFRKNPILFPIRYLIDYCIYGYYNNPAEIEARERANKLIEIYIQENPCLVNF